MNAYLLILLFICHFLADYTHLSTSWMLQAKRLGSPLLPIIAHACVHGLLMGIVLIFFISPTLPKYWNIVLFQIWSHFLIDVWKGKMNWWFPLLRDPANKWHWVIFGFDQLLHTIVIVIMVVNVVDE